MLIATVTGNLGRDSETRAAGDDTVTSFSVASSRKVKGESVTTWVDCSIFGKRGLALKEYLTKGTKVAVVGELSTREHEGKTYLKIRVDQVDLMGGGTRQDQSGPRNSSNEKKLQRSDADDSGAGAGDDDLPFAPVGDVG